MTPAALSKETVRVLIVDDDGAHREGMKLEITEAIALLTKAEHFPQEVIVELETAGHAAKAVERLPRDAAPPVQIVICDVVMPGDDGQLNPDAGARRLYEHIKGTDHGGRVFFIATTSQRDLACSFIESLTAEQRKCDHPWAMYLPKPSKVRPDSGLDHMEIPGGRLGIDTWTGLVCEAIARYRDMQWQHSLVLDALLKAPQTAPWLEAQAFANSCAVKRPVIVLLEGGEGSCMESIAQTMERLRNPTGEDFHPLRYSDAYSTFAQLFGERGGERPAEEGCLVEHAGGTIYVGHFGAQETSPWTHDQEERLLLLINGRKVRPIGGSRDKPFIGTLVLHVQNRAALLKRCGRELQKEMQAAMTHTHPLLRDCKDDIETLALHYLRKHGAIAQALAPELVERLRTYTWQGNERELNLKMKACASLMVETLTLEHVQLESSPSSSGHEPSPVRKREPRGSLIDRTELKSPPYFLSFNDDKKVTISIRATDGKLSRLVTLPTNLAAGIREAMLEASNKKTKRDKDWREIDADFAANGFVTEGTKIKEIDKRTWTTSRDRWLRVSPEEKKTHAHQMFLTERLGHWAQALRVKLRKKKIDDEMFIVFDAEADAYRLCLQVLFESTTPAAPRITYTSHEQADPSSPHLDLTHKGRKSVRPTG